MLVIYTEDMHQVFLYSTIEIVRKHYLGRILVLMPENKYKFMGRIFFDLNQVEVLTINIVKDFHDYKKYNYLYKLLNYYQVFNILFFKSYRSFFNMLKEILSQENDVSFLAMELYPLRSNRFVRELLEYYKFTSKTLVLHDVLGYKNSLDLIRKSTFKKKVLFWLINVLYKNEITLFDKLVVPADYLALEAHRIHKLDSYVLPWGIPSFYSLEKRRHYLTLMVNKMVFLVPGSVDNLRREYRKIIESFHGIENSLYELVLLGKVIDNKIIEEFFKHEINFRYYEEYISNEEYENELLKCNFVIYAPSKNLGYGSIKISGIPMDAFRYGVPLINLSKEKFDHQFVINIENLYNFIKTLFAEDFIYKKKYGDSALEASFSHDLNQYASVVENIVNN